MAFVELDECISIFSLIFFSFLFFFMSFLDFMSRIAVIWISSPELSYVCHTYAMPIIMCSYVCRKFIIKIIVSCIPKFCLN